MHRRKGKLVLAPCLSPRMLDQNPRAASTWPTKLMCMNTRTPSSVTAFTRHRYSKHLLNRGVRKVDSSPVKRWCTLRNACSVKSISAPSARILKAMGGAFCLLPIPRSLTFPTAFCALSWHSKRKQAGPYSLLHCLTIGL